MQKCNFWGYGAPYGVPAPIPRAFSSSLLPPSLKKGGEHITMYNTCCWLAGKERKEEWRRGKEGRSKKDGTFIVHADRIISQQTSLRFLTSGFSRIEGGSRILGTGALLKWSEFVLRCCCVCGQRLRPSGRLQNCIVYKSQGRACGKERKTCGNAIWSKIEN